jgi:hypothetical protein
MDHPEVCFYRQSKPSVVDEVQLAVDMSAMRLAHLSEAEGPLVVDCIKDTWARNHVSVGDVNICEVCLLMICVILYFWLMMICVVLYFWLMMICVILCFGLVALVYVFSWLLHGMVVMMMFLFWAGVRVPHVQDAEGRVPLGNEEEVPGCLHQACEVCWHTRRGGQHDRRLLLREAEAVLGVVVLQGRLG